METQRTIIIPSLSPKTVGPYRLVAPLGRGGMGTVYRAIHQETGRQVAVKMVRTAEARSLTSIRREIQALMGIHHPGVVAVLDGGERDGLPWYAMDLVEGETFRRVVTLRAADGEPSAAISVAPGQERPGGDATERLDPSVDSRATAPLVPPHTATTPAPRPPLRLAPAILDSLLDVLAALCEPLAFVHGEGIVHRDLKPENFIITPSAAPVLVDFGLVSRFGAVDSREVLEAVGLVSGTAAYMAPEQAKGELVDARADLYALGCIIYELVAGRPPFLGDPRSVLWQHVSVAPPPLASFAPTVPAWLEALVARLLEKEPRSRIGYADVVGAALRARAAPVQRASARARAYLYRPAIEGRADPLAVIGARLDRAAQGSGGVLLVAGESGMGKTRLLLEMSRAAHAHGVRVATGSATTSTAEPRPFGPVRAVLQDIADVCREMGHSFIERVIGNRGKILAACEPSIGRLPGIAGAPEPFELPAEEGRRRLFRAIGETMGRFADEEPLLVILDDLHLSDVSTLELLSFLAKSHRLARRRLLVLGGYRVDPEAAPLAELAALPGVEQVRLARLSPEAVAAVVSDMLALQSPPPELLTFVEEVSEGNPFFVSEYLREAVVSGLVRRDTEGRWTVADDRMRAADWRLAIPVSVRDLINGRLDRIASPARELLEAAAVLGQPGEPALLATISGLGEGALFDALHELVVRNVLEETGPLIRFVHDHVRDVAGAELPDGRRLDLHRRAAAALEPGVDADPALAARVARHWAEAGESARAAGNFITAGRHALSRYAQPEAARLLEAALELLPAYSSARVEVSVELAQRVHAHAGDMGRAHALLVGAVRDADDPALLARAKAALASVAFRTGRWDEARAHLEEVVVLQRSAGDASAEGSARALLGSVLRAMGRIDDARDALAEAVRLQRQCGARAAEGDAKNDLGNFHLGIGQFDEARRLYEQALALHREAGDRVHEAHTIGNLANCLELMGRPRDAAPLHLESLAIHRETGHRRGEADGLNNLGVSRLAEGRVDEAGRLFAEALPIAREVEDRAGETLLLLNLAEVELARGGTAEAASLTRDAARINATVDSPDLAGSIDRLRGDVAASRADSPAAKDAYVRARQRFQQTGNRHALADLRLAMGDLALRDGDTELARQHYTAASTTFHELRSDTGLATAATRIARLERLAGRAAEALPVLEQARTILELHGSLLTLARCLCELGLARRALGQPALEELAAAEQAIAALDLHEDAPARQSIGELRRVIES